MEHFESLAASPAQDAAIAIISLVTFLEDGELSHVVNAARHVTDALDLVIQELGNMDPRAPDLEMTILSHPWMQRELHRQQRDLMEVARVDDGDDQALKAMKVRAQSEPALSLSH